MAESCTSSGFPVDRLIMLVWPVLIGLIIHLNVRRRKKKPVVSLGKLLPEKSRHTAALMAFLCGVFGTHRFYLGYIRQGCIQAAGCVCLIVGAVLSETSTDGTDLLLMLIGLACAIWVLVDAIRILQGALLPADGSRYKEDKPLCAAPQSSAPDPMEAIEKLSKLHAQGALTDEEFTKKKAELLNRI